jgi:hypothetical protein
MLEIVVLLNVEIFHQEHWVIVQPIVLAQPLRQQEYPPLPQPFVRVKARR